MGENCILQCNVWDFDQSGEGLDYERYIEYHLHALFMSLIDIDEVCKQRFSELQQEREDAQQAYKSMNATEQTNQRIYGSPEQPDRG